MCPFCAPDASRIVGETPLAFALRDAYPVSSGHTLIVPRRHIGSFFDATDEERAALLDLLARMKAILDQEHSPAGFNIGINDGLAAGQTIPHLHIHLIPRYVGDRPDPRGGVRWIFPDRANYWDSEE
jgi:diadenosine tetraphosphate (Ap4A) HIT family hydrolase